MGEEDVPAGCGEGHAYVHREVDVREAFTVEEQGMKGGRAVRRGYLPESWKR